MPPMRMEAGRAEVLHLCHHQPYKQVRRRPLRRCRRRLTALIGEQDASRDFIRAGKADPYASGSAMPRRGALESRRTLSSMPDRSAREIAEPTNQGSAPARSFCTILVQSSTARADG